MGSSPPPSLGAFAEKPESDIVEKTEALSARLVTALLLVIPVTTYFWFIHQFGVNAIWYDQWDNVALLTHSSFIFHSYAGHTSLSMLWTQHNENRMLFPNLIVLALGSLTNLNIVTEEYLSAVLLVIAVSLIVLANRRDLAPVRWIAYLPVAFLMLTVGQFGDTLFGFQVAWYMVLVSLAAVLFLLDSPRANWLLLAGAIAMAVIGSYSSLQGMFIWPVGLIVVLWRRWPRAFVMTWLVSAVVTVGVYFYHFDFSATGSGQSGYVFAHPFAALEFFFLSIGDVMGKPLPPGPQASDPLLVGLGVVIFLLAVASLALYGRRSRPARSPVGPALICFGVLFALSITYGRSSYGLSVATQSRYVTFDLLILVGCYLCLIERWPSHSHTTMAAAGPDRGAGPVVDEVETAREERRQRMALTLRVLAILLIVWTVWGGAENGIAGGRGTRSGMQSAALVEAHAADAPSSLIRSALFPNPIIGYSNVRGLAQLAKENHLSFFATSVGARLERMSLPKAGHSLPPRSTVVKPSSGSVLRGEVSLTASATSDYPLKAVDFRISGSPTGAAIVLHGADYGEYGWQAGWSSTALPNGSYSVQSIARDIAGHVSTSHAVPFTIEN
jgi:hypothetical protein